MIAIPGPDCTGKQADDLWGQSPFWWPPPPGLSYLALKFFFNPLLKVIIA